MPYHLPISASLNAAAAAALSWAKRTATKQTSKTTLTQQLQDKILDLASVTENEFSSHIVIDPHLNNSSQTLSFPHPSISLLSDSSFSSSQSGLSRSIEDFPCSQSSISTSNSSAGSSPSFRLPKSPSSIPRDDYFFLYLAPRPRTPVFTPCQSEFMSSVFEDDSDEEELATRKVTQKISKKKSKLELKKAQSQQLRSRPSQFFSSFSS